MAFDAGRGRHSGPVAETCCAGAGAVMGGWPAQYIFVRYIFVQCILFMGILAQCILALDIRILGIRIQLTAGGWGWRLANGCCCEGVA